MAHDDVAGVIVRASYAFDLVVIRDRRQRTAGGLAVSDVMSGVIQELTCSLVLFGDPHS